MISWPIPLGSVVRGKDCIGRPFEAEIAGYAGPETPLLSDGYYTPASLITDVVRLGPASTDDDGFLPNDPVPEFCGNEPLFCGKDQTCDPVPVSDQLTLF